jgi:hypothetical protein
MSCTEEDAPYIVPVAGSRTVRYLLRVINTTNRYEFQLIQTAHTVRPRAC